MKPIRILTLNIHKGFSFAKRKNTLEKIKACIRESKANIVCLQEVNGHTDRRKGPAQFEYLADQVWSHYAYGKNAVTSSGHHGNAILSEYPLIEWKNINISTHPFEQRGILYGVINCPEWGSKKLHIMTVHLDLTRWGRDKQMAKLVELIKNHVPLNDPLMICGDFNDWSELISEQLNLLGLTEAHEIHSGSAARTFPSFLPILKLDRIYVRGLNVLSSHLMTDGHWRNLSDHLALLADVILDDERSPLE